MDVQGLKDFVLKHNLEERSISGFWAYFKNYQEDHGEDFQKDFPNYDKSDIGLLTDSVSLRITNWPEDGYNHVVISLRIHYKDLYAGHYKMEFSLTGEVEDDSLSLL